MFICLVFKDSVLLGDGNNYDIAGVLNHSIVKDNEGSIRMLADGKLAATYSQEHKTWVVEGVGEFKNFGIEIK